MRILPYLLITVMLASLAIGFAWHRRSGEQHRTDVQQTSLDLERFRKVIRARGALADSGGAAAAWPETIDPDWFNGDLPQNHLLDAGRPWVELASSADRHRGHPQSLVALEPGDAAFWYNPYRGIIRTRMPPDTSDRQTLDLYNEINGCSATSLFPLR